jgi:hypothetical protein
MAIGHNFVGRGSNFMSDTMLCTELQNIKGFQLSSSVCSQPDALQAYLGGGHNVKFFHHSQKLRFVPDGFYPALLSYFIQEKRHISEAIKR